MGIELAPSRLVRPAHRHHLPPELRQAIDSYQPRTLLGLSVRRALRHLPHDLALELLEAIQRAVVMESSLALVRINGPLGVHGDPGSRDDFGIVSRRLITDAGVAYLASDWNSGADDINLMNFHGIGTGSVAEAVTDTALGAESTTALNPDSTRATGTRSNPAANQFRSVGTLTVDAAVACTEHGLFSQAAVPGGTLWDRSVFSVVNLASGDSLQCTYTVTLSAGG